MRTFGSSRHLQAILESHWLLVEVIVIVVEVFYSILNEIIWFGSGSQPYYLNKKKNWKPSSRFPIICERESDLILKVKEMNLEGLEG